MDTEDMEATGGTRRMSPRLVRASRGEPVAQHVTLRLCDSRVIAPSAPARRTAARTMLEMGAADGLLTFHVVDTHAHALVPCARVEAGQFARRVEIALSKRLQLGCPFDPARIRPVHDQWHLQRSVVYILQQSQRHGLADDPAHDGSSLPDIFGWRVADCTLATRLRALVPRLSLTPPADRAALAAVAVRSDLLAEAACAALALPDLSGRSAACSAARRAAVHVGAVERLPPSAIAEALEIGRRRLAQILVQPPPPPELLRATRIQLRFRSLLAASGVHATRATIGREVDWRSDG
jgi:hypothetical protein